MFLVGITHITQWVAQILDDIQNIVHIFQVRYVGFIILGKEEIQIARQNRIPEFAKYCFLECGQYQENLLQKRLVHEPPEPKVSPVTLSVEYINEVYTKNIDVLNAVCLYAAVELSSQPTIRNIVKQVVRFNGEISVDLTE